MELHSFVVSAVLLLVVTSITVTVSRLLGLGSVLGLLLAGILVGPHTPGPYLTTHVADVRNFTELGVVLLLFLIGLEMRPARLWAMRRELFGLGSLQILLSGLALGAYYAAVDPVPSGTALLIGMTLALSSTAMVMQMLQERGEIASRHGATAFAVLLMQDLAIVPLLALVPILSDTGTLSAKVPLWEQLVVVIGACGLVVGLGRYAVPFVLERFARQGNREGFLMIVVLAVFLCAWMMSEAGLSMALGAFLIGMLLSGSRYNLQIQGLIEPFKGVLMSLFFVAVGMSIDIPVLWDQAAAFTGHTLVLILVKLAVMIALGLAFGLPKNVTVRTSFILAQGGEFGFVLFGAAVALDVIDDATFLVGVGAISVSMLATPLLARIGDGLARRFEKTTPVDEALIYHREQGEIEAKVVLGGYGRVGHIVAVLLQSSGVPFIAFDRDPARVAQGKADGFAVYYGDISDPDLLAAAKVGQAALVVLTIDHGPTALRAVSYLRNSYPRVPVIARARDLESSGRLLQAGATLVFPEAVESGLSLAANALQMAGVPVENVDLLLRGIRAKNYDLVRPPRATRVRDSLGTDRSE